MNLKQKIVLLSSLVAFILIGTRAVIQGFPAFDGKADLDAVIRLLVAWIMIAVTAAVLFIIFKTKPKGDV